MLRGADEEVAQFFGNIFIDRTGMGFLLGYAKVRQLFENQACLDFEVPRQLIDTNLLHSKSRFKLEGS